MGIDVWVADLDALPLERAATSILSDDERERALRFRFEHHRARFVRCRTVLRELIARSTGNDPASIAFRYGRHGKPELDGLHFNVSHSDRLAVIAISRDAPLGIDIERIDRTKEVPGLARTAFSAIECDELRALSPDEQIDAFFRGWARKEAYLKLLGTGFSLASDSFTVSLAPEPLTFVGDIGLRDLDVRSGFACAVATRDRSAMPVVRDWRGAGFDSPIL